MITQLLIAGMISCSAVRAQHFLLEHIGFRQGLPDESIFCLAHTPDNYIWMGSANGLIRYNSRDFVSYRHHPGDPKSIAANTIIDIDWVHPDRLWLATEYGISVFNPDSGYCTLQATPGESGIYAPRTTYDDLLIAHGFVFAGSRGQGLMILDEQNGTLLHHITFDEEKGLHREQHIRSMCITDDHHVLVGTIHALYLVDPSDGSYRKVGNLSATITSLCWDSIAKEAIAATWGIGLIKVDVSSGNYFTSTEAWNVPTSSTGLIIHDIIIDSERKIWGIGEDGVFRLDTSTSTCLFESKYNRRENGLKYYVGDNNRVYETTPGLISILTGNGVFIQNPAKKALTRADYLAKSDGLLEISELSDGGLIAFNYWPENYLLHFQQGIVVDSLYLGTASTGTWQSGLLVRNDECWIPHVNGWEVYSRDFRHVASHPYPSEWGSVRSPGQFEQGPSWIALSTYDQGVIVFDTELKTWNRFIPAEENGSAHPDWCRIITRKDDQTLWTTGWKGELCIVDVHSGEQTICVVRQSGSRNLSDDFFYDLTTDGKDNLYVGTAYNGIIRYQTSTTGWEKNPRFIDAASGFESSIAHTLCTDSKGRVWAGGRSGLYGILQDQRIVNYSMRDGLMTNLVQEVIFLPHSGRILCTVAWSFVDPDVRWEATSKIPVQIESIRTFDNQPFQWKSDQSWLELGPGNRSFQVAFAAIDYYRFPHLKCYYRIEELNEDWLPVPENPVLTFSSLAPGTYNLIIEARDPDFPERNNQCRLTIRALPMWYETLAFRILSIVLFGVIVFLITTWYRQQKNKVRMIEIARERELSAVRSRISSDIHDEIGAGLTLISLRGQTAIRQTEQDPARSRENLDKIVQDAQNLTRSLGEIIWSVNPRNDRLTDFIPFLRTYCYEFVEDNGVPLRLSFPDEVDNRPVHPEWRRNVFLIVKEALNNAVKYGHGAPIHVEVKTKAQEFTVIIKDEGQGFEVSEKKSKGNGLNTMSDRAKALGGSLTITSQPGVGTSVHLSCPIY